MLTYIERRKWSRLDFSERVKVSDTTIGNVIMGKHTPRANKVPVWARELGLNAEEAEAFMAARDVAASPPSVRKRLEDLERQVERLQQRRVAEQESKARTRLRP